MANRISGTRSTFGKLARTAVTGNLIISSGTATEITAPSEIAVQVVVNVGAEFHFVYAANSTAAGTAIGSDATRAKLPAGVWTFPIAASGDKLYIRSVGAAVVGGLSYFFIEED
jgi:hypothetical protein